MSLWTRGAVAWRQRPYLAEFPASCSLQRVGREEPRRVFGKILYFTLCPSALLTALVISLHLSYNFLNYIVNMCKEPAQLSGVG